MAERLPSWSPQHPDNDIALTAEQLTRIRENRIQLTSIIDLRSMWAHLLALEVVTTDQRDAIIINNTRTRHEQVSDLLDHLGRSTQWQYYGFLRSLHETSQSHVIRLMGENPDVFS